MLLAARYAKWKLRKREDEMLNRTEYLLVKLGEECADVAQRATKAITFGIDEVQHDQPFTNAERIVQELADLSATVDMLADYGLLELDAHAFGVMKARKRARLAGSSTTVRRSGTLCCLWRAKSTPPTCL